ncbi:MAG: hypothetical protein AB7O45_00555 [Alphaproteobacteria bacterium]
MSNALFSPINWCQESGVAFTLGDWSTALPLTNLLTTDVLQYARSATDSTADAKFKVDLGAVHKVNVLAMLGLNVTAAGQVRITAAGGEAPAIEVDFTESTIGPFSFSRASVATYWNSSGVLATASSGVPRYDHDPANGNAARGLFIEPEARTNMVAYSADGGEWTPQFDTTIDDDFATAPDGTATFAKLIQAGAGSGSTFQGIAFGLDGTPSNSTVTVFSLIAKAAGNQWLVLRPYTGAANRYAYFDLTNGVLGNVGASASARITALGDGRYRCEIQFTTHSDATTANASAWMAQADGTDPNPQFTGDGASGVLIWGVQWEECDVDLAWTSSYIPTAGAAATRAAEVCNLTSTAYSALISGSAGSMAIEYTYAREITSDSAGVCALERTGSGAIRLLAKTSDDDLRLFIASNANTTQVDTEVTATISWSGSVNRSAAAWDTNDAIAAHAGTLSAQDTSVTLPTPDELRLGSTDGGSSSWPVHVRWFAYWNARLSDAYLQAGTQDRDDYPLAEVLTGGWVAAYPIVHAPSGGLIPFGRASATGALPADERPPEGTAYYLVLDTAVDARYVTVEFDDTANPDGYIQASHLWVGYGERPDVGVPTGELSLVPVEEARKRRSRAGTPLVRSVWKKRRFVGAVRYDESTAALRKWLDMSRRLAATSPVLVTFDFSGDQSGAGLDLDRLSMIGIPDEPSPIENLDWNHWGWTFAITEL